MANQEHLDILAKGVETWNAWRRLNLTPNLRRAHIQKLDLSGVDLSGADLRRASLRTGLLSTANLVGANLSSADLSGADLSGADLTHAVLVEANLHGAKMSNVNLSEANLTGSHLSGANLEGATFAYTTIGDVNLGQVGGLNSVIQRGPSTIGLDTIYRSQGKIPEAFLRGAGVPENFITYMKSLTGSAFDFYSCFISYSTKDQAFADRLHADLQARGVRCWFAPHDIQGGRKIHEQIDEAIKIYDKLLLILSDHSMTSNWVKTEIANARAKEEQQKRQMLFPISIVPFDQVRPWKLFNADTGIDSAREIREFFIPDFSNWKDHDVYARTFAALVRSLKADTARATAEPG